MAQWYDITRSPKYQELNDDEKLQMKQLFFTQYVIPKLDEDESLKGRQEVYDAAFRNFMQIPDDTGQGYVTSMLGAAGRGFGEVVPGVVEGVGALTGIEPIQEAGQDIRAGLEYIAPVNPIYAESVPVKLAGVGGQIGSVLATGGIGGAAGRALAAERIAAAGTQAARQAALTQAVQRGAQTALLGTAAAQGAAEGAQQAEQYGMIGPEAYLRTLAGAATEVGTELLPFGMAAETALAKRALASAPRTTGFVGSTLSEGGEEALAQIGSNIATQVLAPAGVETPGITEGALEAGLYGAAGGAMLGGVNALISTPPERQTQIQRDLEAEVGAIPKDTVPDQTNEQKLNAMNAGGTTVVDPNGKTAVIPPAPTPAPTPTVVKPAANPAIDVANKLNSVSGSNPDARQAAAAAQADIDKAKADADAKRAADEQAAKEAAVTAPTPITTAPTPITPATEPEPIAELPPPSPSTGQPTAPAVGTATPTTTPEDAAPEIPLEESLRQEPQDRVEVRTPEETVAGDSLLRPARGEEEEVAAQPPAAEVPPQAPQPSPNLPALVAVRDVTKPEQMSKFLSDLRFYGTAKMGGDQYTIKQASDDSFYIEKTTGGQRSTVASGFSDIEGAQQGVAELVSPIPEETAATGQPTPAIEQALPERGASVETIASGGGMSIEEARQFLASRSDGGEPLIFGRPFSEISGMQQQERPRVLRAADKLRAVKQIVGDINKFKIPVSQEVVNTYGITLPEGYVKQGDLYVFQPTAASPLRISIPEGATSSRTDNVKYQVAGLPDEVVDPFLAHGTDSADAVEALVKSGPRKDTEHYEGRLVPKDDGSPWGNTKTSASFVIISKPGQTTSSPNEIGAVVVNRTSRGDEKTASMIAGMELRLDGTGVAVLTPEELPNWLRRTVSQPTAAETQTPDSVAVEPEAPAAQPPAAEPVTTEVTTPEAEAQQKKDEKEAKKLENESRASLARLVAGERGNPVFGNVTMDDGIKALRQLDEAGDLPNIFFTEITTTQEFLSKPENEQNFPDTWAALSAGGKAEGMEEKGTAFVFIDNVGVTNLDRKLATQFGTTPEVAAVRRVAVHESIHKAISFLNESEQIALFRYLRELYSPEQLDVLAETYTNFANWRESKSSYLNLIEESLTRTIDSMDSLPKDGILGEFIQWLKGIWRKITGKKGEPTLNDMKDVMRLIRNGLRNSTKARADRTISGGVVRYSAFAPQAPATDAEYLAAVEAGDMEKAQRMVDEAAKAAGYNVSGVGNGITYEAGDEPDSVYGERDNVMSHGGAFGFYFSDNPTVWSDYAKPRRKGEKGRVNRTLLSLKNPFRFSKEFVSYDDLQALLRDGGIALPAEVKSRLDRLVAGGFGDTQPVWKWLHPTHVGAGASYGESLKKSFTDAGYDGVIHPDSSLMEGGLDTPATSYVVFSPSQIKSADPVTRDDNGRIIPPSQRFQTTSPDIRFSLPTLVSESASAFSSGQQAARAISFTPRQLDVYMAVLGAFSTLRRKGKQSATMQELFDAANTLVSGITPNEFSETLQGLYNDNAALLNPGDSTFQVFNRDGELAGAVVLVAKDTSRASLIPPSDAPEIASKLNEQVRASVETDKVAKYTGRKIIGTTAEDHMPLNSKKAEDAATSFFTNMVNARMKSAGVTRTQAIMDVADTAMSDSFSSRYLADLPAQAQLVAHQFILAEAVNNIKNELIKLRKRNAPALVKRMEAKEQETTNFWNGLGTFGGTILGIRAHIIDNKRYGWMFAEKEVKDKMQKRAEDAVTAQIGNPGTVIGDIQRDADETASEAGDATAKEFEAQFEEDAEMTLLREGEAELDGKRRTIWERIKLLIRRRAMYARRKTIKAASAARASLSKAEIDELNAILLMSDEEAAEAEAKDLAELDALMAEFLGEDKPTDTPTERAKKGKRKGMVKAAEKIIFREGKDIEFRKTSAQEAVADLFNGADEYGKIVEEVGNALLSRVKQAKGMGGGQTAIKQLVESIKKNLLGNLPTPKPAPPTNATLGKMLAMTFSQQIREARLYADAWSKGRTEVRNLLAETGLEGEALENELDAIMPPTPALAYAPNAAKRAIALAMEQAGVTREELTDGRVNASDAAKAKVMAAFDAAAAAANLSAEGWSTQGATGRQLAERAMNEAVQQWDAQDRRRLALARIVAEQSENPVALVDFTEKVAPYNLKPAEVLKLFDRARSMADRRIEIAEQTASNLIYRTEEQFRQGSKDLDESADKDSINKAFRDQVSEPLTLDEFIQRLAELNVGEKVATNLFRTAARERIDRRQMAFYDMLQGPRAAGRIFDQIMRMRRGIEMPLQTPIPWAQLLGQKTSVVSEYRQRVLDMLKSNPSFQDATDEQRQRLADLFTSVWQDQYAKIFANKRAKLEQSLLARDKEKGVNALRDARNEILESINLGVFNDDALVALLAEKFGVKSSFTEAERKRIEALGEELQDETINKAIRNRKARELITLFTEATDIPASEIASIWWVASVLSGMNTVFSIGAAFTNGAYEILGLAGIRSIDKLIHGDFKGAIDELTASVVAMGRYLKAFPSSFNRAWQYLWSGDVAFLEAVANDPLSRMKSFADLDRVQSVADILAKDPNAVKRFIGLYTRFMGRLLTALDAFNIMVTKRGAISIALRQSELSMEQITDLEQKVSMDAYRKQIVSTDPMFKGEMPKAGSKQMALLNSMAEAIMYENLAKFGANMENADYIGSQAAMTLQPTGAGGFIYNTLMGITEKSTKAADEFLRKAKLQVSTAENGKRDYLDLVVGYIWQFAAYQSANILGYRFARFAGNKFNQGISFLPFIGLLRLYERGNKNLIGKEQAFMDSIYRNQMIGFAMMVVGYLVVKAIAEEPDDEKRGFSWNGNWSNLTPEQIKQKLSTGEKQFTIRIGNKVFNYQNWPMNQMFAAIGSMSDLVRYSPDQWDEKTIFDKALSATVAGIAATAEIPALTQAGELFGNTVASKDPTEQYLSRAQRIASSWVGGFSPRILKDLDFMAEPSMRKYETLWEKTASHIPIYRRYVGEEYYDILGKQIEKKVYPGSREFMTKPSEPEYRILGALNSRGIFLTPANAEYRMVGKGRNRRRLTQQEADAYSLETGKAYKTMILRYGPRALKMSPERARAFLSDKADEVRDRVLMKVYRGYRSRPSAQ